MGVATPPKPWQVVLVLTIGILAVSTGAILVRLATLTAGVSGPGFSLVLAASRLTLAAIVLLPTCLPPWPPVAQAPAIAYGYTVAAGLALAIHFAAWITSLSYTSIVASTTLVTTNPVWVALIAWVLGEKPSRLRLLGIGIALLGSLVVGLGSGEGGQVGTHPLLGNGLALVGAWAASAYFLCGRQAQRLGLGVGRYVTLAYTTAAIVLLPLPLLMGVGYTGYPLSTYGTMLLMALLPQLIGHTSFNWAVRWMSPTLVTLVLLFEPIGSSALGYALFLEVPGPTVLLGAAIVLLGVAATMTHEIKA